MSREKQIKTTDWLIKGIYEEELKRKKQEAIKEAEAELKQKQIEEMRDFMLAKSNSANVEAVFTTKDGKEIVLGQYLTKLLNDVLEQAFIPFLAETLYTAGYRKQSEGEWILSEKTDVDMCSKCMVAACKNCGEEFWYKGKVKLKKYCPNCGAKMKGGE